MVDARKFWDNFFEFLSDTEGQPIEEIEAELKEDVIDVDKVKQSVYDLLDRFEKEQKKKE